MPSTPLFSFGHGLSYTTFEYSPLKLEADTVDVSGELRASLTITNSGKRRGTEVVQIYAADTHIVRGLLQMGGGATRCGRGIVQLVRQPHCHPGLTRSNSPSPTERSSVLAPTSPSSCWRQFTPPGTIPQVDA
jgi:hypothetical protein